MTIARPDHPIPTRLVLVVGLLALAILVLLRPCGG